MNLRYTDGCICTSYDINGTEFMDLTINQQRELAIKLINYTNNVQVFVDIYSESIENIAYAELCKMSDEQLKEAYTKFDDDIMEFKNNWTDDDKKKYCISYITDYDIEDSNASWLYQHIFEEVLEADGNYKDHGYCDCCGDHIREYTLTI